MPQDPKKAVQKRISFLSDRENKLKKRVSSIERKLFSIITSRLLNDLDTDAGAIKSTQSNIKLTQRIDRLFNDFKKDFNSVVIGQLIDDLFGTLKLNDDYFNDFSNAKRIKSIKQKNRSIMYARLGVTSKGKVIEGGFIDNFLNDTSIKTEVVNATIANVTSRAPKAALRDELQTLIIGAPDAAGGRLQSQYRTFVYDTYQEFDRSYGQLWADELKLTAFLYLGGKIKTTRKFCCERNGLVFTTKEAMEWKKMNFAGKPRAGYNPLVQLGGHNCRHSTQWLSNDQALLFRKDLEIKDGKLVKKRGVEPQKLNQGCGGRI